MSNINELKNHHHNSMSKCNSDINIASRISNDWKDKVGAYATMSTSAVVSSWTEASDFSFKSLDVALETLGSVDAELENVKSRINIIRNEIESIGQNTKEMKEFV